MIGEESEEEFYLVAGRLGRWIHGLQMGGHDWEERFNLVCVQRLQLVGVEGFYLMEPIQ